MRLQLTTNNEADSRGRSSKGQYLVIEEMVVFLIGMLIVFGSMAAFQTFGDDLKRKVAIKESNLLGERIASLSVKLASSASKGSDCFQTSASFETPSKITGRSYIIDFVQGRGVTIRLGKGMQDIIIPLRGLEDSLELKGNISSEVSRPRLTYREQSLSRDVLRLGW